MGRYWEEFELGEQFDTDSLQITADRIERFAEVSGDSNPFHLNPEYAEQTIYKQPIAHGMLIMSVFTGLNRKLGILKDTSLGVLHVEWDFLNPVYVDDTIFFRMTIDAKQETSKPDRGLLKRKVVAIRSDGKEVCRGYFLNLVKRKPKQ
jgi:3-hydroxybutyryl-CoA dehydratase